MKQTLEQIKQVVKSNGFSYIETVLFNTEIKEGTIGSLTIAEKNGKEYYFEFSNGSYKIVINEDTIEEKKEEVYNINIVVDNGSTTENQYSIEGTKNLLIEHGFNNPGSIIKEVMNGRNFFFQTKNNGFERIHLSAC